MQKRLVIAGFGAGGDPENCFLPINNLQGIHESSWPKFRIGQTRANDIEGAAMPG